MKASVSSITKKGLGYNIEVTFPKKILGLFAFIKKVVFYCSDAGCVDCQRYKPVRNQELVRLLTLAYNKRKKQDDV